jgi:photosystem II stability/assembly factor-like uncharacterized protein
MESFSQRSPIRAPAFPFASIALAAAVAGSAVAAPHRSAGPKSQRERRSAAASAASPPAPSSGVRVVDIGPERGIVPGIDGILVNPLDPDQLLAPSYASVFKSTDAGRRWRSVRAGLFQADGSPALVTNLRRVPGQPFTVYASSEGGLFRSTDFGDHWIALARDDLDDVAANPADSSRLLAVGSDYDTRSSVLYLSTDAGATFAVVDGAGLPGLLDGPHFTNVTFSPRDAAVAFVVDGNSGLWRSGDRGATFTPVAGTDAVHPLEVFPHPARPEVVFLQALLSSTGLLRSDDGGLTFAEVHGGLPETGFFYGIEFVAFDPHDAAVIYATGPDGVFRSADGGRTFAPLGLTASQLGPPENGGAITLTVDPARQRTLYVNTPEGNFKSVDGGATFRAISSGFRATTVTDFALSSEGEALYVVADATLLRSRERGEGYEPIALPDGVYPRTVAVSPRDPDIIYLTTTSAGFFRSTDAGRTWTAAEGDTSFVTGRIFIDPRAPSDVNVFGGGLYRSTDGGVSFSATPIYSYTSALAFDPARPGVVYSTGGRGFDQPLLLKSSDAGATFAGTLQGLGLATALAVSPDGVVYVGGLVQQDLTKPYPTYDVDQFLVRSTDGGATFTAVDAGLAGRDISWIGIESGGSSRLFAYSRGPYNVAYQGSGTTLYSSTDGLSWSVLDPLSGTFPAQVFALDRSVRGRIYLGGVSLLAVDVR